MTFDIKKHLPNRHNFSQFSLDVAMNKIAGLSVIDKYGRNSIITTSTDPEDIWEGGGIYNFSATNVNNIDTISSSDASDVGQLIKIEGSLNLGEQGTTTGWSLTNGQNKVVIFPNQNLTGTPLQFWRVNRMENEADAGGELQGILNCYVDTAITGGVPNDITTIRAQIVNGNNQTLMAIYTIPPKQVGFLYRGELGITFEGNAGAGTNFANFSYQSRRFEKIFKVKKFISLITIADSSYLDDRTFPDPIPGLTDIKLTTEEVSVTMGTWGTFCILLMDEQFLDDDYLKAINQPGF